MLGVVRLLIAAVCGGLIGAEREVKGRQAGFRTNVLVCVGCAVVMVVSIRMAYTEFPIRPGAEVRVDPSRIAYGVMGGIGFLGAGTIVRFGATVRGLTTAAGIWAVAGLGLAAGLGLYLFAFLATLVVLAVLWGLDYVERLMPRRYFRAVVVRRLWDEDCISRTVKTLRLAGFRVTDWSFERRGEDLRRVDITVTIGFTSKHHFDDLADHLPENAEAELVAVREG
ncbi:MAG: mgtC [Phycisphaerales bacterium]|nr:mgtC [Phycisphaerales bacterium]